MMGKLGIECLCSLVVVPSSSESRNRRELLQLQVERHGNLFDNLLREKWVPFRKYWCNTPLIVDMLDYQLLYAITDVRT